MRIRTDGKHEHRRETIQNLADHYGVNRTRAVLLAADQLPSLHQAVATILERDDLTRQQRREIAETLSSARGLDVEIAETVDVEIAD